MKKLSNHISKKLVNYCLQNKMITDIFDRNIIKILTLFSITPGSKFTRKEIKDKTLLHNVPLDEALTILLNNKILLKEKRFFSLNFENENTKNVVETVKKEYVRFKEIPLKIYYLLIDICSSLSALDQIKNIYLFGSFAKLIYTEKSDIDLAIVLKIEDKNLIEKIRKEIGKIERKYQKPIEGHFFEEKDLSKKDPLIKEIKKNNVVLF